jgi:hypothetical protein
MEGRGGGKAQGVTDQIINNHGNRRMLYRC